MSVIQRVMEEITSWFRGLRADVLPEDTQLFTASDPPVDRFSFGIEILNDDKTPMNFVVEVLQSELNLSHRSAVQTTIYIHNKGSVLLPLESQERANRVAESISSLAHAASHPLVCRAVSAQQGAQDRRAEDSARLS